MQPVAPAASRHQPSGEFVHDHDLAVLDHVVDVALVQGVGAERLVDVMQERHVDGIVETSRLQAVAEHLLADRHSALGQRYRLVLLVNEEVAGVFEFFPPLRRDVALGDRAPLESRDDPVHFVIELGRLLRRPGDDQGRARLVDQDAVHLVDDRVAVAPLHELRHVELHVVAEVVESELVVRPVRDVRLVRLAPLMVSQVVLNDTDRHSQETIDPTHPLRVAPGEVVVHGDDMDAVAVERVEVGGKGGHQRLSLAGLHLRDLAAVQHDAANQLHVEMAHREHAAPRLAHHGECISQKVVEAGPLIDLLAEGVGVLAQFGVGACSQVGLSLADPGNKWLDALEIPLVLRAEDLRKDGVQHHIRRAWREAVNSLRSGRCRSAGGAG